MKLIFLGDSFTEGVGIDIEYGIQNNLLDNNYNSYYADRKNFNKNTSKVIYNFQINNCWPMLLSKEIENEIENRSRGASGADLLFLQLLESEKKNKDIDRFYIICLPKLSQGRIMISNEKNSSINNLMYFFNPIVFYDKQIDINFYKKYFNKIYMYMYYLNFLMSLINYLKSKKINFLFLPTWESTIMEHFFKNTIKEKEKKIFNYYQKFFFSEIKDQMNFKIDHANLEFLPCGHANIKSQYLIKDIYKNYILEKIK